MPAESIAKVIEKLEKIVRESISSGSRLGIFAQLYLGVTRMVAEGIEQGRFEDGPRMERLDVLFANRYLDAYEGYSNGQSITQSWKTAFDAAQKNNLLTLQHLLMGMNAHINLDLGIAAAETVPASELENLKADFFEISKMLTENIEAVQSQLNQISPLLFLLDWTGKKSDEQFAEFSLKKARQHSWQVAKRISKCSTTEKPAQIEALDGYVSVLNKLISKPGILLGTLVKLVKLFEVKDIRTVIQVLG